MTVLQQGMCSVHTIISEYKIPRFNGTAISEYEILIATTCITYCSSGYATALHSFII